MAAPSVPQDILNDVAEGRISQREAARRTGTHHQHIGRLIRAQAAAKPAEAIRLEAVGYQLDRVPKTPAEAWDEHATAFEHKISKALKSQRHEIRRADASAYVIYHATDVHLDDDAVPLRLLEADIRASHGMGAITIHGGDALNAWPQGGKLAGKYGDQAATMPDGLLRLRHYIDLLAPSVWVDGNHDEWNSHLPFLIENMLPSQTITDYWTCDFRVRSPGGRDLRVAVSHKFAKGSSWFHRMHGHVREALEAQERDLLLDGHLHSAGVMEHTLPERQHTVLCVASAGYKVVDRYAARISHGGKLPRLKGRAHWIVVDPQAAADETFCAAFTSPQQAEAVLNGLQNLRAA